MGATGSTAANDDKIAAQNIGHFDHSYEALLVTSSPGMVPEPVAGTPAKPAAISRKLGEDAEVLRRV